MPRIAEQFLDSVVYLYRTEHEALEGIKIGGSGFTVIINVPEIPDASIIYVVTNRHVIKKADVVRFNTKDGKTHIEKLPRDQWIISDTDDVAIKSVLLDGRFEQKSIPQKLILTKEAADSIKLGIGDNIFMVGRFINHEGAQKNVPLARFGSISQMAADPLEFIEDGNRYYQECIIADIRSIGGYSGSPVFLNEHGAFDRLGGKPASKHWLIGLDCGHVPMWSPVCGFNEEPTGDSKVNINSGMAGIIPSWKLWDILMSEKAKEERRREVIQYINATKASSATKVRNQR